MVAYVGGLSNATVNLAGATIPRIIRAGGVQCEEPETAAGRRDLVTPTTHVRRTRMNYYVRISVRPVSL